jgi:hypothetical protein
MPCPPEIDGYVRFGNCCELQLYLRASDDPPTTKRKMPVLLLVAVVFVLLICLLVVADRAFKAVQRGRRLREADRRLTVAVGQAEARNRQRKATEQVSGALTSVMPTIHDIDTRHVDEPGEAATM